MCRKFYIHPEVLSYCARAAEGGTHASRKKVGLSVTECALLQLLDTCKPVARRKPAKAAVPA